MTQHTPSSVTEDQRDIPDVAKKTAARAHSNSSLCNVVPAFFRGKGRATTVEHVLRVIAIKFDFSELLYSLFTYSATRWTPRCCNRNRRTQLRTGCTPCCTRTPIRVPPHCRLKKNLIMLTYCDLKMVVQLRRHFPMKTVDGPIISLSTQVYLDTHTQTF